MDNKTWKEMTKLDKRNKRMIAFYILMVIFEIIMAIVEKEFVWIIVALLWGNIAVMEYCNAKLIKGKDVIVDLQEEHIEIQDNMINDLLEYVNKKKKIIKISDIKISKKFKAPNKDKLNRRYTYFDMNENFEVPIVVDNQNILIDGYTSYLIAKHYNFSYVEVEEK